MATSAESVLKPAAYAPPTCKVALLGFGTVGSSVARILQHPQISQHLQLTAVCTRSVPRRRVDWLEEQVRWTEAFDDVLASDADVVIELIGGIEPAATFIRRAFEAGKSVVTANKQLIAHHGTELVQLAHRHGCHIAFGASVAGGIPVIHALQEGLAGDRLVKIQGVLNGTCNFILTRIENTGATFASALEEAQKAGYAEADPTDDVEGYDARAKLVILARVGLHVDVRPEQIPCAPVTTIERIDFEYAHELGCTIRQISRIERAAHGVRASVQPCLVALGLPLAQVVGSQNVVLTQGEFGGQTGFSGLGAGGHPTAVAVVSDVIAVARNITLTAQRSPIAAPHAAEPAIQPDMAEAALTTAVPPPNVAADFVTPYYLRFTVMDKPGILGTIATILGKHEINIDSVLQHVGHAKSRMPFVVTLEPCDASILARALSEISQLDFFVQPVVALPILR